jgi:hypothetical protein
MGTDKSQDEIPDWFEEWTREQNGEPEDPLEAHAEWLPEIA